MNPLIGIGLRPPHYDDLRQTRPAVGWLEVHSENYFERHSQGFEVLSELASHYPVSLHGVGMSLGSADPLDQQHLRQLAALVRDIGPVRVSEHLSWGSIGGRYFNDLLPVPYTRAALARMSDKIETVQQTLGRQLLIENPSSYLQLPGEMSEWEFLAELSRQSGCGILLDLNNLHVSAFNHGFDCADYFAAIDLDAVGEIHLAGYTDKSLPEGHLYIDTHSAPVAPPVWDLYRQICARRAIPTLIEWDLEIPPLPVLLGEAELASEIISAAPSMVTLAGEASHA
ncbi:MNIO family bufferin maturase [Aeromonas sp. NJAU223]|uniref:MNIO family bufferin maturase n=1 Tax=Aeromonas sp. NJAU223 TaxID=3115650 RepID=UPI003DA99216